MVARAIARDSIGILSLRVLLYAATFLTGIIVSRALGPEGRGEYYLPYLGALTLVTVGKLGIDQGAFVLYGNKRYGLGALWRVSRRASWSLGTLGALLLVASPWLLPSVYGQTAPMLLVIAAVAVPLQMATLLGGGLLTMGGQVMVQFRGSLAAVCVQTTLLVALWARPGLTPAIVLATGVVGASITWWVVVTHCRRFPAEDLPRAWVGEVMRASLPLHVSSLLLWMHLRVDMFMVSAMGGAAMLGLYSLAVMLSETVQMATDSVGTALQPHQATGTLEGAARLALTGARINTIVGGLGALGWLTVGPLAVPLVFGAAFHGAVLPLVVLLPGMVALGWQRACGSAIIRAGRPWQLVSIHGTSLALNAALNWLLIPRYGPAGAAAASTVSYCVSAGVIMAWTVRLAGARASDVLPRVTDVTTVYRGLARAAGLGRRV
jgi:O-antigen/teichoic acid export membrane protein